MIESRCKDCLWFDQQHKTVEPFLPELGMCRKKWPMVVLDKDHYRGKWVMVDRTDLCGEFMADRKKE